MFKHLEACGGLRFTEQPPTVADLLIFANMAYCPMERLGAGAVNLDVLLGMRESSLPDAGSGE